MLVPNYNNYGIFAFIYFTLSTTIQIKMKNSFILFFLVHFLSNVCVPTWAQTATYQMLSKTSADGKYSYQIASGDPTQTRFYTLANGLKVILSENKTEPRIMGLITTRAGSKNDPSTNTGLAHYLEHMLFKGTDKYGSLDFEKEKMYLDQIESLYEKYNKTKNESQRKDIYSKIDSLSGVAAKYAIANEYDKMMAAIGSNMTNAFTSFENTTYMENFPSNNLEKFLMIQDERFRNPVLRLFHTELEAVYEEKNISLDRGSDKVFDAMFAGLFKKHPYGTQTTIGTVEHLKNPSLIEIKKYYNQYYIPNNMVVILAGDIDADQTIAMVDQYFGDWKSATVPEFKFEKEDPITQIIEETVTSPDEESVAIGFRMPDQNADEALLAELTSSILYNGASGLIDKNLVKSQKVLEAFGFHYLLSDYGMMYFGGKPLQNQSMQEVKDLILGQIEALKSGQFEEDLIQATVNNLKVSRIKEQENPMWMAFTLNSLFSTNTGWDSYLRRVDAMGKLTKKEVQNFANKWFAQNYMVVYKKSGEDTSMLKVPKPEISPVEVNRNSQSDFLKSITETPSTPIKPVFVDYKKDIKFGNLQKDVPIWMVPNKINKLFTVYYVFDMGSLNMQKLPLAIEYLKLIGSKTKTNEQINKELYTLAVEFNIFASEDQVYVSLSGLEENFDAALNIIEELIRNPKPDQKALDNLVEAKIKQRNDNTLNKEAIFWEALDSYVDYGAKNPYNQNMNNAQLRKLKAKDLTDLIKNLFDYKHKVYYYGPRTLANLSTHLKKVHTLKPELKEYPAPVVYEKKMAAENTIYFVDYDMVQAEISMQRWADKFDAKKLPIVQAFNEYYGGGMSSVVFQDIRESKALAYSTYSYFSRPSKKEDPFQAGFYVGTQADKLPQAMDAMNNLLQNFPESEKNWEIGKKSIKQSIETRRISKTGILFNYQSALRLGLTQDTRKDIYSNIDQIQLSDLKNFHASHMQSKNWNMKLIGSKSKINMEELSKYGKVVELSLKDIFGYEVETKTVKP